MDCPTQSAQGCLDANARVELRRSIQVGPRVVRLALGEQNLTTEQVRLGQSWSDAQSVQRTIDEEECNFQVPGFHMCECEVDEHREAHLGILRSLRRRL
jgi:hypothetical protein